ncbi:hypothetical protein ACFLYO_03445 [Chloroflexota bacterium]
MSDRDELFSGDFEDDDFFGDDDDLFGEGGDSAGGFDWDDDAEPGFDDLEGGFDLELGDEGEDTPEFGDDTAGGDGEEAGTIFGLNRIFVILAAVILVILCLTMGVVGTVLLGNRGPSDVDLTVTAVYVTNTYVAFLLEETATQNAINADETATAESWTATPSPTATETPEPTATPTTEAPPTMAFQTPTPNQSGGGGELGAEGLAATATALAEILGGATPTVEGGEEGFITPTPSTGGGVVLPTQLPDTGLFDDSFAGGKGVNGLLAAAMIALGLGAVIAVSRWLRTD